MSQTTRPAARSGRLRTRTTFLAFLALAGLVLGALTLGGATSATAATKTKPAKVTIAKVSASGAKVTVSGKVTLPSSLKNTGKNRKKVKVRVTLTSAAGKKQTVTAKLTAKRTYKAAKTTTLTGPLKVTAQVLLKGKKSGKAVTKKKAVTLHTAAVTVAKVSASGTAVTIAGTVTLPSAVKNTTAGRKKVTVALTLANAAGTKESFTTTIDAKRAWTVTKTTTLTGPLTVTAQAKVSGTASGKAVTKKNAVTVVAPATVTIGNVTASGAVVTIPGTVTLPSNLANTAANRATVSVALTLADATGTKESFTTGITDTLAFTTTHTTALTGNLTVTATVKVAGKVSGATVTKTAAVQVIPDGSVKLEGLFGFDAGQDDASGKIWGTYFAMGGDGTNVGGYLINANSTARDKTYTLLRPGTDGGLRTDIYQPAPSPAFDTPVKDSNGTVIGYNGNALANRITQPQNFFGVNFSISTDNVDRQSEALSGTGYATPLPQIYEKDGVLYGQLTAWTASWNGAYFNQGSPKPVGVPAEYPATPVTGTYDPVTRHYTLHWNAKIYSGPFDKVWGNWWLEGTFTPAAELAG